MDADEDEEDEDEEVDNDDHDDNISLTCREPATKAKRRVCSFFVVFEVLCCAVSPHNNRSSRSSRGSHINNNIYTHIFT